MMAILVPRLLGMVMLAASASAVAADPARDAQLAAFCAACHRLDDGPGGRRAPIAGLEPSRFESLMKGFRTDGQPNHIMHAVSLSLSDDEIAALASFLAARDLQGERP